MYRIHPAQEMKLNEPIGPRTAAVRLTMNRLVSRDV